MRILALFRLLFPMRLFASRSSSPRRSRCLFFRTGTYLTVSLLKHPAASQPASQGFFWGGTDFQCTLFQACLVSFGFGGVLLVVSRSCLSRRRLIL